jgi:hypothetical protein
LDFSLKEPKERTLEERQREMSEDFQAGRSVEAIVYGMSLWMKIGGGNLGILGGTQLLVKGIAVFSVDAISRMTRREGAAAIAASDKFCGLTFGGVIVGGVLVT